VAVSEDATPPGVDIESTDDGQVQITLEDEATHGTSRTTLSRLEALALARTLLEASRSAGQSTTPAALARARSQTSVTDGGDRSSASEETTQRVQVRCHHCGFSWTDNSDEAVVTCPACDASTEPTG
jgi:rubrerythrin